MINPIPDPQKVGEAFKQFVAAVFGKNPPAMALEIKPAPGPAPKMTIICGLPHLEPFKFMYHYKETPEQAAKRAERLKNSFGKQYTRVWGWL